ncbi:unnamed protein product [Amoebophrya sp. A120]|nr:unnamed protein product [Amoebophrya sp. A120]|eukprot:GSA120T00012889001.1
MLSLEDSHKYVAKIEGQIKDKLEQCGSLSGKKFARQRQGLQDEIAKLKDGPQYKACLKLVQTDEASKPAAPAAPTGDGAANGAALANGSTPSSKEGASTAASSTSATPDLPDGKTKPAPAPVVIEAGLQEVVDKIQKILDTGSKKDLEALGPMARSVSEKDLVLASAAKINTALATKKPPHAIPNAISVCEQLAFCTSLMSTVYLDLLALSHEGKLAAQVTKVLEAVLQSGRGNALPAFLPVILGAIEKPPGSKWKVKLVALDLCGTILDLLREHCPKQMASFLPQIVPVLRGAVSEVRGELKEQGTKLLTRVGEIVTCPEIRTMAPALISCLLDFGNMKLANETLYKIANTTFLHYVDAASFALLFPIVHRAMKERQHDAKKNGIQIVGACVILIEHPDVLMSYLPALLPTLEELAVDPTFEIQREAAKAFGTLSKHLPDLLQTRILPWLLSKLESNDADQHQALNDRTGAGHSLSEVLNQVAPLFAPVFYHVLIPRLLTGNPRQRDGALWAVSFLCKADIFERYVDQAWCAVLKNLTHEDAMVNERACQAGKDVIQEFGGTRFADLFPPLAEAVLTFECIAKAREMAMDLVAAQAEKIAEMKKYGQDYLSMTSASLKVRYQLVLLLLIGRADEDPAVRRQCGLMWKEGIQSGQKAKRETLPVLMATLQEMQKSANENKRNSAKRCLAEVLDEGEETSETAKELLNSGNLNPEDNVFVDIPWDSLNSHKIPDPATIQQIDTILTNLPRRPTQMSLGEQAAKVLDENLGAFDEQLLRPFAKSSLLSFLLENLCVEKITTALSTDPLFQSGMVKQEVIEKALEGYEQDASDVDHGEDLICRVDNLMLMYGGGHLLLKDTIFELRKGQRYGVVGRNGAGKTTLMNLIASGGVSQIPADLQCVHVKPEVLQDFLEVTCVKWIKNEHPTAKKEELEKSLAAVHFPPDMWNVAIGELSGGWRMRLLIANSMMKHADVLLLDEPTNHLDVTAVQWLCDYLVSLHKTAIMVISHDPLFLNRVCTKIINYANEKLVYYEGNFDAFKEKLNLNDADAEELLAGQIEVSGGANGTAVVQREGSPSTATGVSPMTTVTKPLGGGGTSSSEPPASQAAGNRDGGVESPLVAGETTDEALAKTASVQSSAMAKTSSIASAMSEDSTSTTAAPDRKAKIVFPIPGKVQGLTSLAKPVIEIKDLRFAYNTEKGEVLKGISQKVTMNSRVAIRGKNGAGKSTLMNLICGEIHANASAVPQAGTCAKHRNCRLAYLAQHHMFHLQEFLQTTPYIYIQKRFANGYDQAYQDRLKLPRSPEELEDRKERARKHGKYGNMVHDVVGRQMRGKEPWYEIRWENLDDAKQNTWENLEKLRLLGIEAYALAYDDRMAAQTAQIDQRPLSAREITKHFEQFGLTEELVLNRNIGMFSAGQKSKVTLAAAFWTKPHVIALDEPTNYIDMETLDSLTLALQRFKGGVICISHSNEFVKKVCTEQWMLVDGQITLSKGIEDLVIDPAVA